ncbi:MAG: HD domain-containing protein [Treponema sp.]|nr:HD domain-containing protein [Treponema sp.]
MNRYKIGDLPRSCHFSEPTRLDRNFVLTAVGVPMDESIRGALIEWDISEIFSEGEPGETCRTSSQVDACEDDEDISPDGAIVVEPGGLRDAQSFYVAFERYVRSLFDNFTTRNNINFGFLVENFRIIQDEIRKSYKSILQARPASEMRDDDFLVHHTMTTTIVATIIGDALNLSDSRITELGAAALLHEIGMLRLPPESYLGRRPLTSEEKKLIYIHPIIGYNFLKSFDFPQAVSRAVLEHHERENGSGYPKQKTDPDIHLYSKILSIACSYSAMSGARPYRKAVDAHAGMLDLLRNKDRQYNDKVVRAFVSALSIFPIGMYVELSDGKRGQVADASPKRPNYPVIRLTEEKNFDGSAILVRTSESGVSVARALLDSEAAR